MTQQIIDIIRFSVPMQVTFICGLLLWRMARLNEFVMGRKILSMAVAALGLTAFNWLIIILYFNTPAVFAALNSFVLLSFTGVSVVYYRFIFELTKTDSTQRFSSVHFLLPLIGFGVMLIWSFFVPFDVQRSLVESHGTWSEEHRAYSAFFTSKLALFALFDIIYAIFGLRRVMRFRREVVNYSADVQRSSLTWLYQFLIAMLASLPLLILTLFLSKNQIYYSWIILILMIVAVFRDVIFTHNVLLENFVIIKPETQEQADQSQIPKAIKPEDVKRLESYMHSEKPYLKTRLRIIDMTKSLSTNRTYGMNFSRYINSYRMVELDKLKTDPANADVSELELVVKAGFSDYRGYLRVKQRETSSIIEPMAKN